jgi:hypothetical protein
VRFERLHNFRDLGGYPAADGRQVRWGQLWSDSLGKLGGQDAARFGSLGVRTVIDLRYPREIGPRPRGYRTDPGDQGRCAILIMKGSSPSSAGRHTGAYAPGHRATVSGGRDLRL